MSRTSNHVRDSQGVIVTLAHRTTGDTVSIHRPGFVSAALKSALEPFDATEYRVTAISTPSTILMDLRGRQEKSLEIGTSRTARLLDGSDSIERPVVLRPELVLLARIGAKAYL